MNEALEQKLRGIFEPEHLEITDNSWQHAGHVGAPAGHVSGTHLAITIVSAKFQGVPLLDRHRLVHQALKEEMNAHLHALELKTRAPGEN